MAHEIFLKSQYIAHITIQWIRTNLKKELTNFCDKFLIFITLELS